MAVVLVTGSAGLVGSESVRFFCERGYTVVGIDNNMRQVFFGKDASTEWSRDRNSTAIRSSFLARSHPVHWKYYWGGIPS
jgi:nucleoside-diphosphate-sugar epimerase